MGTEELKNFIDFNYDLILRHIKDGSDDYYQVTTRELDPSTFYGVGDSVEEAIKSFARTKAEIFEYYIENGIPIPKPDCRDERMPSGKFVVRIAPATHAQLLTIARDSGQSLNSVVKSALEERCIVEKVAVGITEEIRHMLISAVDHALASYNVIDVNRHSRSHTESVGTNNNEYEASSVA